MCFAIPSWVRQKWRLMSTTGLWYCRINWWAEDGRKTKKCLVMLPWKLHAMRTSWLCSHLRRYEALYPLSSLTPARTKYQCDSGSQFSCTHSRDQLYIARLGERGTDYSRDPIQAPRRAPADKTKTLHLVSAVFRQWYHNVSKLLNPKSRGKKLKSFVVSFVNSKLTITDASAALKSLVSSIVIPLSPNITFDSPLQRLTDMRKSQCVSPRRLQLSFCLGPCLVNQPMYWILLFDGDCWKFHNIQSTVHFHSVSLIVPYM